MSFWRLVRSSLAHYRRTHAGVVAGFAVAAAVLVGALLVGDSVRGSLRARAEARIGRVDAALVASDRTVREELAEHLVAELSGELPAARCAPLLVAEGLASADGGARRAGGVSVLGVDGRFFALAPAAPPTPPGPGEVLLDPRLARRLDVRPGDEVLLRVPRPSALPRDMVLATTEDASLGIRARVAGVAGDAAFGAFALAAGPLPASNAFVDLAWLQEELELGARVNVLLASVGGEGAGGGAWAAAAFQGALLARWTLDDAEVVVERLPGGPTELRTPRVFLDDAVARAAGSTGRPLLGILTYFVNELAAGERSTPYSMVSALGPLGDAPPDDLGELPLGGARGPVAISSWLADDLEAGPGDELALRYFVPGPDRRLREETRTLTVGRVVPLEELAGDPTLMPPFPGLADVESCRDWETGVPVDLDRIRDQDERYWDEHRGTPKAFLPLAIGREMWASRFGSLTAIRTSDPPEELRADLRAALDPAELGLFFRDVRGPALAGVATPNDFGVLFLSLSSFLLAAALLLAALLFVFGIEQRAPEIGILLAVGFPPRRVRRLLLGEAALLATAGCALGALAGVGYTRLVLLALGGVWSDAVASTPVAYHGRAVTVAGGALAAWLAALGAAAWTLRGRARRSAVELLAATEGVTPAAAAASPRAARASLGVAIACGVLALALPFAAPGGSGPRAAGVFFGAGAALLAAALACIRWRLARGLGRGTPASAAGLGVRNAARRPGRSLAVAALLACGTFLVVSIGVHQKDAEADGGPGRATGTGGFAFVGRSSLPVYHDLDTDEGREAYGLRAEELEGVSVVPMRVRDGDEASCLNLGAPQAPRLAGVRPEELARRGAFAFAERPTGAGTESPWLALAERADDGAVPAIGDAASVTWSLHKSVGDTLDYVDERGEPFRVRIVGTVADSILQGTLLVSEEHFRERFSGTGGYRMFLVDAPAGRADEVAERLSRALAEEGLALVPASERLAELHAVQNTYLDVFQVLGALGVLLGSVGLGVVVLRNALERRRELAILTAVGYSPGALRRMLAGEHGLLLALGWGAGMAAAALALTPAAAAAGGGGSLAGALPTALAVLANGAVWIALATLAALRFDAGRALRSE